MRKAVVLSLVASGILFAQEAKYNIFVRSFPHSGDSGKIENFRKSVEYLLFFNESILYLSQTFQIYHIPRRKT